MHKWPLEVFLNAAVETDVLNMESCELKTATKANQHHSLFAKSSISSCLIQKTLVFITHTCCTRDTEPTAARNKHSCGNTIPLSIYITSLLVSMQIKLIPHRIGDLAGTVWSEATAWRPDVRRGVIIITGCRVMTSSAAWPLLTIHVFLNPWRWFLHWHCSAHHEAHLLFIPHGQTVKRRRTCVCFFNDTVTHAEPCINADCDSWGLVGSSGLNVHSHIKKWCCSTTGRKKRTIAQLCDVQHGQQIWLLVFNFVLCPFSPKIAVDVSAFLLLSCCVFHNSNTI